jgi:Cu(I)/Ag(I) efflux system membrane protein CusA/SilA
MSDIDPRDPSRSFVAAVIRWSAQNGFLVATFMLALAVAGVIAVQRIPLDAIPDLSDTQVIIRTEFPGQAPQIVEDLVTYPLSTAMLGLPRAKAVRGFSMFGDSFVYIVFKEGTDQYWARSRVTEALSGVRGRLPQAAEPRMGPDATGVGWIYQYALVDKSGKHDLAQLRSLQDWFLKFELSGVAGVAEVASVGGFVKEYQVLVDPNRLRAYGVPLERLRDAVMAAGADVGGRTLEQGETEYVIRSKGYAKGVADLRQIAVSAHNGTPVLLADVARVEEGAELRQGVTELNGEGEAVGGFVVMRSGEHALAVVDRVKRKLEELQPGLPEGVEIVPVYDRAPLVEGAVSYLAHKLVEEAVVVALVTLLFLMHFRSAFVAILSLPLGVLAAFIAMRAQGMTADIMSLSGIAVAVGAMVDASVVMVENACRKLSGLSLHAGRKERTEAVLAAAAEVGPALFFSLLVITASFLPVFALTGQSYRLFAPLAFTKTYAMFFAALLSVTAVPVLMIWLMKGRMRREEENPLNRFFVRTYMPVLKAALRFRKTTLALALSLLLSAAWPAMRTGSEFMPALYEGDLLYMPMTLPGASVTVAKKMLAQTNRVIKTFPEVETVFGKAGRADTATDPAPIAMIETWIRLKPKEKWRAGLTPEALVAEMDARLKLPGLVNSWGYPVKIRIDMVSTGVRTPVGIKISGADLQEIERIAAEAEQAVRDVPGTRSAFADRVGGGKYLDVTPDRQKLARHGIDMGVFQDAVQTALGGMKVAESVQGRERYGIMLRYDRPFRERPRDVEDVLVTAANGAQIPLGELASVAFTEGPPMIKSENARLNGWVFVDVAGRDLGSYVEEAQRLVAARVKLPPGYAVQWAGQFEQMLEAKARLSVAVPASILVIFVLLMLHFGRLDRTLMVMLSLPFALVGGIWALYLAGYHLSVAAAVGFIALAGVAAETAVVMLIYLDGQARERPPSNLKELAENVLHGAAMRVRPKLMTVSVVMASLLPVFFTDGVGADVMRRIALPMVGGMATTTILTLIVIPVVYYMREGRKTA